MSCMLVWGELTWFRGVGPPCSISPRMLEPEGEVSISELGLRATHSKRLAWAT